MRTTRLYIGLPVPASYTLYVPLLSATNESILPPTAIFCVSDWEPSVNVTVDATLLEPI